MQSISAKSKRMQAFEMQLRMSAFPIEKTPDAFGFPFKPLLTCAKLMG